MHLHTFVFFKKEGGTVAAHLRNQRPLLSDGWMKSSAHFIKGNTRVVVPL